MKKIRKENKTSIRADVIVLGCGLPGIVTASKLKKKFGDSMDIVVLDLPQNTIGVQSKCNVAFQQNSTMFNDSDSESSFDSVCTYKGYKKFGEIIGKEQMHTSTRQYLIQYGNDLKVPLPPCIINPLEEKSPLQKIFQFSDGSYVPCTNHYNDFDYLNIVERFELNQYQNFLDQCVSHLFSAHVFIDSQETERMLFYDQTTMEKNICDFLLLPTSREIMRTTVKLVCGAPATTVSLLFYLHQCYRTSGTRNHVDGLNTRHREKLLGYCRKRIAFQLQESVADITLPAKSIKYIRTHTDADVKVVILETLMGDTTYICTLLAMALKPEELQKIEVDRHLLPEEVEKIIRGLAPGKAKKFLIQYEENFWETLGYSGDIFSLRGPILWAMARPRLSFTGSVEKYAALVGYLMVGDNELDVSSKDAVIEQLTKVFGSDAATPVTYRETAIGDVFIPRCGDYVGLKILTTDVGPRGVEWGAFDVFADGDVAAALEAGHLAYLHLLSCLRPQAMTYEDSSMADFPMIFQESPLSWWLTQINIVGTIKLTVYMAALVIGFKLLRSYMKN